MTNDIDDELNAAAAQPRRLSWEEREEAESRARQAARDAQAQKRKEFRAKLFGTDDPVALLAPESLQDYDALLGEHAAQLRNAIRHAMEYAVSDSVSLKQQLPVLAALDRLVRANVMITRTIKRAQTRENSTL